MADHTHIEWTDATWNPVRGCTRVSAGCQHCYAETVAGRFSGPGQPYEGLIHPSTRGWNGQVRLVPEALAIPWRWTRGRRIFVNSMSDLFHPAIPFEFIAAVFFVMSHTTRHTYQVLTKRPERMLEFFEWVAKYDDGDHADFMLTTAEVCGKDRFSDLSSAMDSGIYNAAHTVDALKALPWTPARGGSGGYDNCGPGWPYENVWLGVSVEDQAAADERIPLLLQCPAAVRWISAEPLLGPVDLTNVQRRRGYGANVLAGYRHDFGIPIEDLPAKIDWVVVGGESGQGARPMRPGWVRDLREQCDSAGTPFLFKQWGEWHPCGRFPSPITFTAGQTLTVDPASNMARIGKKRAGRLLDGVLHDAYPEPTP